MVYSWASRGGEWGISPTIGFCAYFAKSDFFSMDGYDFFHRERARENRFFHVFNQGRQDNLENWVKLLKY